MRIKVYSNLTPNKEVLKRLNFKRVGLPGWFALPIINTGALFFFLNNPLKILFFKFFSKTEKFVFLCFNPSFYYFICFLLPLSIKKISLYQWRPISRNSVIKKYIIYLTLSNSDLILVYSYISYRYIRKYFGEDKVKLIDLYTDTDFFSPKASEDFTISQYILIPGNHLRDESYLNFLSEHSNYKLIRVTRDINVKNFLLKSNIKNLEVKYNISYDELRSLYQNSSLVLILSDSSEIPTGITSLCEAISCGVKVIVNQGHSNIWMNQLDIPYKIVENNFDNLELLKLIDEYIKKHNNDLDHVRKYAENKLSLKVMTKTWLNIFEKINL